MQKQIELISQTLGIPIPRVSNTIQLIQDKCTVPFIARYRKEKTGSLDEIQISNIQKEFKRLMELIDRKTFIINQIDEQGKLTDSLRQQIDESWDSSEIEDLYLPYKKKRKTKAEIARADGLEPLAKIIMAQRELNIRSKAKQFTNHQMANSEQALEGARYIISEWINESNVVRKYLRETFEKHAEIRSKVKSSKKNSEEAKKFTDYFDHSERLNKAASHRILAMLRAEKLAVVKIGIHIDKEIAISRLNRMYVKSSGTCAEQIELSIDDAYKRLLHPSLENEFKTKAKEKADKTAIDIFANNLQQLLMSPPTGEKVTIGLDPGFRTGCKLAVVSAQSELLYYDTIYPNPPQNQFEISKSKLITHIKKYNVEQIAIGNGTASRETEAFAKAILKGSDLNVQVYIVNEAGASIYSASEIARKEFPNIDLTVRGAVSIARRLMDPLAELVKIDAKSIGVGQYQHDVNQQQLKSELDDTVSLVVNKVGVNVNTASHSLLSYVSGIGPKLAENIVNYRYSGGAIKTRTELKKIKGLGAKAFEQSAGFLKVLDGDNPLDKTFVHPESYHIVKKMAKTFSLDVKELVDSPERLNQIDTSQFISSEVGKETVMDIINEIKKPGLDPRGIAEPFSFAESISSINDLIAGMELPGIVNNLTKFGAFVDIGIKEGGLIHISNMSDKFISDPSEVLKLDQKVLVQVLNIDLNRKRIQLKLVK